MDDIVLLSQQCFDYLIDAVAYCWDWADGITLVSMPFVTLSLLDFFIGGFVGNLFIYITFRVSGGGRGD